jgi:hypothetical protein
VKKEFVWFSLVSLFFISCPAGSDTVPPPLPVDIPADFAGLIHTGYSGNVNAEYEWLDEIGSEWVHRDFSWGGIQGADKKDDDPADWNWAWLDSYVSLANAKGKKVLGMLLYDADWIHAGKGEPQGRYVSAEEIPLFREYAVETVRRYIGVI